jgi:hypothetical protein
VVVQALDQHSSLTLVINPQASILLGCLSIYMALGAQTRK